MFNRSIFSSILGLSSHWCVTNVKMAEQPNRLEITVGASAGVDFSCPLCQGQADIVSEQETRWLHENILNLRACITAILPMMSCHNCGTNRVPAPWEKSKSHFRPLDANSESF